MELNKDVVLVLWPVINTLVFAKWIIIYILNDFIESDKLYVYLCINIFLNYISWNLVVFIIVTLRPLLELLLKKKDTFDDMLNKIYIANIAWLFYIFPFVLIPRSFFIEFLRNKDNNILENMSLDFVLCNTFWFLFSFSYLFVMTLLFKKKKKEE